MNQMTTSDTSLTVESKGQTQIQRNTNASHLPNHPHDFPGFNSKEASGESGAVNPLTVSGGLAPSHSSSASICEPVCSQKMEKEYRVANDSIDSINKLFNYYWLAFAIGIPLSFVLIGIPAVIAGVVFHFVLLHRLWTLIQDGSAPTTPDKAVGFSFIPGFNLYWRFVAFRGLAVALNQYSERHSLAVPKANEGLACAACILSTFLFLPTLYVFVCIPDIIVTILAMKSLRDTAVGILKTRTLTSAASTAAVG